MTYRVYILHSASLNRYYVGFTRRETERIREHNRGKTYWTSRADDWQEVYTKEVATVAEARTLEKAIKSRGARRFLAAQS